MFRFLSRHRLLTAMLGIGAASLGCTLRSDAQSVPIAKFGLPTPTASAPNDIVVPTVLPEQMPPDMGKPGDPAPLIIEKEPAPGPASAWLDHPKPAFIPRAGFFGVPPTGPGYYSVLDMLTGNYLEKPPPFPYSRTAVNATPMFDADFRYVDKPGYEPDLLERLHRIHIGDNWLFATGGEFRFRYYDENNSRLTGRDNHYELTRLRVFGDLWYKDAFRIYVEAISAQDFNYNPALAPALIDRNYLDLLNAFVDVKIYQPCNGAPWYARVGRQEMVLGSQRMISALDWANTRRTFDGVRIFEHGEKLDIDLFWVRPVIPNPNRFDAHDTNQNFFGAWVEYRPTKTQALDLYYLYLDDGNNFNFAKKTPAPVGQLPLAPYDVSTLGYRYSGNLERNKHILFDSENALQFGHSNFARGDIFAGASTTGLGYSFGEVPLKPTVWAYFDYASGSNNIRAGDQHTFNQLYPFGHYYFGGIDYIGRQNILDWNFHLFLYPTNWLTLNFQYHILNLASASDALYNASGQILRQDATGKSGTSVGEEFVFISNFHLTPRQDIFLQYSHLAEGRFLQSTGFGRSAETLWLMYNIRW